MKVLITGSAGFIGSHLVDSQLAHGQYVRAVDTHGGNLEHGTDNQKFDFVLGDITDEHVVEEIVQDINVVYHLASAHLDVSLSENRYRHVNVDGTMILLKAAQSAGVKRFVHCSSVGVMGDIKNPPADETYPCAPTNIYEQTKLNGEQAALKYSQETGFPVVVARPAWVYGPRCPRTQKLFRAIGKGRFPIFGNGKNLRHPIYITDCIRGLELCADVDNITGQVFIIAGSVPVQIEELTKTIAETLNVPPPKIYLPMSLGKFIGVGIQTAYKLIGRNPPFSERSLDFFQKNNAYNISKARNALGYKPRVDLPNGLDQTLRFQHGTLYKI